MSVGVAAHANRAKQKNITSNCSVHAGTRGPGGRFCTHEQQPEWRINMTNKSTVLLAALAMGFAVSAAQSENATHEEAALSNAKVSLSQAIGMAEKQGSGLAISAEDEPKQAGAA